MRVAATAFELKERVKGEKIIINKKRNKQRDARFGCMYYDMAQCVYNSGEIP